MGQMGKETPHLLQEGEGVGEVEADRTAGLGASPGARSLFCSSGSAPLHHFAVT